MNICFVCKYPPIQGGVSMHGYWAARGLAERGHRVFVVTNADEVEDTFRIRIPSSDRQAGGMYAPAFEGGGKVEVRSTKPPDRSSLYYIPMGNPTVTRLATMAVNAIREHECQVIFAYYLEPYGMAAHLASLWSGVPYVFKHAGSDLNRLMPIPELGAAYREVLLEANRVLSGGMSRDIVLSHGVPEERIEGSVGFGLPTACFNAAAPALDFDGLLGELRAEHGAEASAARFLRPLDPQLPILGIYGKLGEYKGSFDLIRALGKLDRQGFPVQLVAVSHGWQESAFRRCAEEQGVADRLRVLPFMPHWRIPEFITACDALAFLEREFPIAAHTPTIPTEILSCAGCLIVSEEVLRKQLFRWKARQNHNLVVVSDPRDIDELATALRFALTDRNRARQIGRCGLELVEDVPSYDQYVAGLERVLQAVATEPPIVRAIATANEADSAEVDLMAGRHDPLAFIERRYPYVHAMLDESRRAVVRAAFQGSDIGTDADDPTALALAVGKRVLEAFEASEPGGPACDVCRYELEVFRWCKRKGHASSDQPKRSGAFPADPGHWVPRMRGPWEIRKFDFDVECWAIAVTEQRAGRVDDLPGLDAPMYVLFHEGGLPKRVNPASAALLLMLDDNCLSVRDLVSQLCLQFSLATAQAERGIHDVLEALYWEGALLLEPGTSDSELVAELA